jgi:predicted nucleic acid-binding protein
MPMTTRPTIRVYLDNCTWNRSFDDQTHLRIRIESEATLYIQEQIQAGQLELVWSFILDFENDQNPFIERQRAIKKWKNVATIDIDETVTLLETAKRLAKQGLATKDALHVASAIEGQAEYFLTTDDKILRKLSHLNEIKVIDPVTFIKRFDVYDN